MQYPAERSEKKGFLSDLFNRPESLPLLLFILFFAILYGAGPDLRSAKFIFDPPWLLIVLNTLFVMGLCLLIAGLCFWSFLRGGFLNVLLLGCSVLAFGVTSFAAGWLIRPPYGLNEALTIRNIGVLCAAASFFLSSLFTAFGISMEIEHRRGLVAVMACTGVFTMGAILTAATLLHFIPPFFIAGEGPTVIRQVVLAVSVTLFTLSAILMMMVYSERKTGFLLYSINALLLFGAGIVGVGLGVPGSPLSWLGRAAQYMGNVYLVVASVQALTEARRRGTTVEKALAGFFRKSERHYKALVEMAADAIIAIDREGKIILMNPTAEETLGYSRDEAAGQSLAEQIVPGQSWELFHACLYGEPCRNIGMDLKRKDGSIFPAELSFSPELKSDGGSERTIIIRDITERKQAEQAVQSVALFPIQNPEPVLRIHRDGTLLFSNPAAEPVLKEWRAASVTGFPAQVRQTVEAALHEGEPREFEIRIAGRDFSFVAAPIVEGQYANLYGWDVTESKRAEQELMESEERLRLAAQAAGFGAYDGDPATGWAYWSPELKALFGLSPEEPPPVHPNAPSTFIHPEDRDRVQRAIQASFDPQGSGLLDEEHRIRRADGEWRWVQVKGRTSFSGDGEERRPVRAIGIVLDITGRKRAEEALRENEERYRGLFESMNEGFALHELLYDESGEPCDYRFLDVNPAFERQTGLKRENVIGKTVLESMPGTEPLWIKRYGEVALTGTPAHFESHSSVLGRDYEVFAYRPAPGQFAVIFMDITVRRRAEESLRASYDLLKIAQRAANAGLWAWDVSTGKLTWSEEFFNLFGLDPATSASFDTWLGILHPDDRQPAMERINRSIQDGIPLENEYRIIRPDGEERWIRAWGSTFYDENAQPLSMSGICVDATDSKRAEEALRASELRMKAVADHLPVGVWFADGTGKIVYGNEAGRRIWAGAHYVDPDEFHVYRAWWAETGKPLGPEDWAVTRAARKGETSLNEVLEIECFDGTRKTILNSAVPLKSDASSLLGVVVLNEDITERIEAEQALRRSEARYRSYIEVTGQMGWTTNADGEVVDDVPEIRQYTGQTFDEVRGRGWSKALHPDDVEITLAVWRKSVEEKQGYETEFRMRRHDGVYRYFMARSLPVFQADGSVREWVGTCIDITERRKQEEELQKLNRTLRALSRSNEALMRAEEESAFLEEVCRIVIQDCGHAMVWIGFAADDEDKTVRPVAHAGFTAGYLETMNLTWADRERGRGPTGTAIRSGKPILCANMLTDPRFEPWRDEAIQRGYASSLALPLLDEGRAFGAVTIYSTQPDPFSEEEIKLLSEMADDLTYGIASLRLRLQSRQTLQALRESEARFRQLADSMPQLVWTAEPDGSVDYYNGRLSLFASRGQWTPGVYDEDFQRTVEAWKSAVRTGSPYEIEHRLQIADGRFRWFLTRAVPVPDETGQVMKWYGTSTDVHDRKQAEEERENARIEAVNEKNRLEALIKTLPVGVALVDTEGGTIQSNDMFEQIWGGQRPETRSVDDYNKYKAWWIDSGRQVQPDEWASARAIRNGETVTGQLMKIVGFDGTMSFAMNSAAPIYDSDGRIAGSAVAIQDITERIEAEKALQKVKEELEDKVKERTAELLLLLEDLEKSRDDLRKLASELVLTEERERKKISVALHDEVAQTLAAARMRIDLLRSKPGDDDFRRAIDEAQQLLVQAIRETRALMTDISNPVLYDMGLRVAVQSLTEEVTARKGISVSCSFGGRLTNLAQDLEVMIFQLVKELVQNIVKHSGARKASIRIVEEGDDINVVVADDGLGFDAGSIGSVGVDGGFGLFSIRERVKSYHGKIRIESEPGKGSEVTVTLPKRAAGIAASRKTGKRKEKI